MAFFFENLDLKTREHMIREIDSDLSMGILFMSPRIRPGSEWLYVSSLRAAARSHDETWLADQIRRNHLLKHEEERTSAERGVMMLKVPLTAPDSLAAAEFNRFYARAVCARAVETGVQHVEVYRAKVVPQLLPESELIVGRRLAAESLLRQLRKTPGLESALGLPGGPLSGFTIRLIPRSERREEETVRP